MFANTFSRPRCGMATVTSWTAEFAASDKIASSDAIADSPPSKLNRFCPTYLVCKKFSNASAAFSLRKIRSCSSRGGLVSARSMRSCIHCR